MSYQSIFDQTLYYNANSDFIPITVHFNQNTLLTKNGELIQTIKITGFNAQYLSPDLLRLKQILRVAIQESALATQGRVAWWLHTIRSKTDLSDHATYPSQFATQINDNWVAQNQWNESFSNDLYISMVMKGAVQEESFLGSLLQFERFIAATEKQLQDTLTTLNTLVAELLTKLHTFKPSQLTIINKNQQHYSELVAFYRRLINMQQAESLVQNSDLANTLNDTIYALGNEIIEVISNDESKKFASVLSFKAYREVPDGIFSQVLQLPIEMVCTEVLYHTNKTVATKHITYQDYILGVSGDNELQAIKSLDQIMSTSKFSRTDFCMQQLQILVINDDLVKLSKNVQTLYNILANLGVKAAHEDIMLEHAFWVQLPGNFNFLKRLYPILLNDIGAFSCLYNTPPGRLENPWGRSLLLMKTIYNTPYFLNLHNIKQEGNTWIFGDVASGRTTTLNFLLAATTKYNPKILHLTIDEKSRVFIKGIRGEYYQSTVFFNPLLCKKDIHSKKKLINFFKIVSTDQFPVSSEAITAEDEVINDLVQEILKLPKEQRKLSNLDQIYNFELNEATRRSKKKFAIFFDPASKYYGIFDGPEISIANIQSFNLWFFTDLYYSQNYYPSDPALISEYRMQLFSHQNLRAAYIEVILDDFFETLSGEPAILAIDEILKLLDHLHFTSKIKKLHQTLQKNNAILLAAVNLHECINMAPEIWQQWNNYIATKIILPLNNYYPGLGEQLDIKDLENFEILHFPLNYRAIIFHQDDQSMFLTLRLENLSDVLPILSSTGEVNALYDRVVQQYGTLPPDWLAHLHALSTDYEG